MPLPEVIIFDLDDTIIAWESASPAMWEEVCRNLGDECRGIPIEELYRAIRDAGRWYWSDPSRHREGRMDLFNTRRKLVVMALNRLGIDNEAFAHRLADEYSRRREESARLFPDSITVLTALRERGFRLAMITNGAGDMQRAKLERFALEPYFDYIQIEGEFGAGKPGIKAFEHVLSRMNVTAGRAWMVGNDLEHDIAPCITLGIHTIWLDVYGTGLPEGRPINPDGIIRNIAELPGLLEGPRSPARPSASSG